MIAVKNIIYILLILLFFNSNINGQSDLKENSNKHITFLLSTSFKENAWKNFSQNKKIYSNYSPRTLGVYSGVEMAFDVTKKIQVYGKIENEFLFTRFSKNSKYYSNQLIPALGGKIKIFQKGIVTIPIKFDLGYGLHIEKFFNQTNDKYTELKKGFFLIGSIGGECLIKISDPSSLGFRTEFRYQKGEVDINLPDIDTEEFYDYDLKLILLYQYDF